MSSTINTESSDVKRNLCVLFVVVNARNVCYVVSNAL